MVKKLHLWKVRCDQTNIGKEQMTKGQRKKDNEFNENIQQYNIEKKMLKIDKLQLE